MLVQDFPARMGVRIPLFLSHIPCRTLELGAAGPTTETLVEWDLGINIWTQDKERLIKFVVLNTLGVAPEDVIVANESLAWDPPNPKHVSCMSSW